MCEDTRPCASEYKKVFQTFIEKRNIRWVPCEEKLNMTEKYLLLVDIQTRIPEDVQFSLNRFKLKGKSIFLCP